MSHPFNSLRNDKVQKARVPDITKACSGGGMAAGGAAHADEAEDKSLVRKMVKGTALRASGGAVKARADRPGRAWGGRSPKKGGSKGTKGHTVNVIVAPHGNAPPMSGPPPMVPGVAAAPPPMPPKPPMMPPGPGPAPGGPPLPPGMHYAGGRTRAKGGKVVSDADTAGIGKGRTPVQHARGKQDTQNIGRGSVITKATGGPVEVKGRMAPHTIGGAGGGKSRLDKAHHPSKYIRG